MAKWALWAAHRYVWAGAAAPRTVGPDGRLLQRPWRVRSERAAAEAHRVRAARPQSRWPRLLGWACIGVACVGALMPVGPLPPHVPVSAASGPGPEVRGPAIAISSLTFDEQLGAFRWPELPGVGAYRLVLLGADYREITTFDGIERSPWKPTDELRVSWKPTQTYHAYLLAVANDRTVKSPMVRFVWQ